MRFIRDIIDEKKTETWTEGEPGGPDVLAGPDASVTLPSSARGMPDPMAQESEPERTSGSSTPAPSDEQALRNIFKTEAPAVQMAEPFDGASDQGLLQERGYPLETADAAPDDKVTGYTDTRYEAPSYGALAPREPGDAGHRHAAHSTEPVEDPDAGRTQARFLPQGTPVGAEAPRQAGVEEAPDQVKPVEVPQPAAGRMLGRSGRVKTRVLGFGQPQNAKTNVFKSAERQSTSIEPTYPVGWLVLVHGPGKGSAFALYSGVSSIGRNPDQTVALAFGDNSISRENHAAIAYDAEQRSFFLGHGGKANLVRLNDRPVLSTEELKSNDVIRIGETTLRFVALCGEKFSWSADHTNGANNDAAY